MKRIFIVLSIIAIIAVVILPDFVSKRAVKWSRQHYEETHDILLEAAKLEVRSGIPFEKSIQRILDFRYAQKFILYMSGAVADLILGPQERENEEELKMIFSTSVVIFLLLILILGIIGLYWYHKHLNT